MNSKQYESHVPLSGVGRAAVALGSAVGALLNPARADLVAALGETTGGVTYALLYIYFITMRLYQSVGCGRVCFHNPGGEKLTELSFCRRHRCVAQDACADAGVVRGVLCPSRPTENHVRDRFLPSSPPGDIVWWRIPRLHGQARVRPRRPPPRPFCRRS